MNVSAKQTRRHGERTCGCRGGEEEGEGCTGSVGFSVLKWETVLGSLDATPKVP